VVVPGEFDVKCGFERDDELDSFESAVQKAKVSTWATSTASQRIPSL